MTDPRPLAASPAVSAPDADPRVEYSRRLEARRAEAARFTRLHYALGNWRLAVFALGILIGWLAFGRSLFSPWWLAAPLLVFLALAVRHETILQAGKRVSRAADFYTQGLKRLNHQWAGSGVTGARFADPEHPYAADLDIFGYGSLFELLCTARTRAGENCLAAWLREAATPETIRARQTAVAELRIRLDLREDLAGLGEEVRSAIHPEVLIAWGEAPVTLTSYRLRFGLAVLAVLNALALIGWAAGYGSIPFAVMTALARLCALPLRARVKQATRSVEKPAKDLALFALLLERLEQESFQTPLLQALRAALDAEGEPPSIRIARLQRRIELLDLPRNQLLAPLGFALLWTEQCAFAVEAWRARNGPALRRWLDVVGEFEALCALAGYAYEHPDDPFPEIAENATGFEAEGLGHPLLSEADAVRNDVNLNAERRLLIVSGSNMSGKSTLLRTIGTNTVLALAGAPVRARRLRLSPFCLGASIRTQDSRQAGISRFYAEILRLRQIVDLAAQRPPVLYLLDEILHGTNSHDRRIGAEAVLRALLARGALGLATTHDLALAQIVEDKTLKAANVHLEDQLQDGKMTFDYHLRPGVVTKSNAIELMRAVGLEV